MRLLTANKELECYRTLREAMLKLFGKVHVGTTAAQSQFVARAQGKEENIHRYYSNLKNLSKIAFPTLTPSQRKELNDTRFIDGINSDELRQKILDHWPKSGSVLKIAEKYERACSRKRVGAVINMPTMRLIRCPLNKPYRGPCQLQCLI